MKLQFTIQSYQTEAVESVADAFAGQPFSDCFSCRRDAQAKRNAAAPAFLEEEGYPVFANAPVQLSPEQLLENIHKIQARNHIRLSPDLKASSAVTEASDLGACSLDVEMETGTGKTYVYIKTMFELNRRYGWSKFVVVVPGIAIREGVCKSFEAMQDHFMEHYGRKARFFVYDPRKPGQINDFSQSAGLSVIIINIQAFNARGEDARRIRTRLDAFGSRSPMDVIRGNRPIILLDEPQKMGGSATQESLKEFAPLFFLNYSATHKQRHTLVYVLDALDAYSRRLVKKIQVKGIEVKNLGGTDRYLFLERIVVAPDRPPMARLELEAGGGRSVCRKMVLVKTDSDLYSLSENMEQYRGCRVGGIDPLEGTVTFTNGEVIHAGEVWGDVSEADIRRVQIRETIKSHFEKEKELYERGIKTLSLFFIDQVAKYRKYDQDGKEINSEYGEIFEQEYISVRDQYLWPPDTPYGRYLRGIQAHQTHAGYFSIDRKGRKTDSPCRRGSDESDDVSAYELILKDRERLLSFENPVRFLFSHSALREGWDNPNVFQICVLKHGGSSPAQKRQEVGRGLRLCVDQNGERQDRSVLGSRVHQINQLTVIAAGGYRDFVADLQRGVREDLYHRPAEASLDSFAVSTQALDEMIGNGYMSEGDGSAPGENFCRTKFHTLGNDGGGCRWTDKVKFDSQELIAKAIARLDAGMSVAAPAYTVTTGGQGRAAEDADLEKEAGFAAEKSQTFALDSSQGGRVRYDLVGKIAEGTKLTRRSAARILAGIRPATFAMFQQNPEEFIAKAVRLIREQKEASA